MEKDSFIIIDSNSLINRAYYAMTGLVTSRGEPVGAVYGFAVMLIKLLEEYNPKYVAATFDVHAPTFRHEMTPLYKATRKPMPPDLATQFDTLKELLDSMGIKRYELAGYEADDIIGTLAKTDVFTYIVTGDRDSLQLVDAHTHALLTKRGITEIDEVSPETVSDVFGVTADRVIDFKALAGDSSDNIPGVAGIGDKSAAELLNAYGSLDGIYGHIDEIKGARRDKLVAGKENAYLSYRLAAIDRNVPIDFDIEDCKFGLPFPAAARAVFERCEFKSLLRRDELFAAAAASAPPDVKSSDIKTVTVSDLSALENAVLAAEDAEVTSVLVAKSGVHFAFDGTTDYFAPVTGDLFSAFTVPQILETLMPRISGKALCFELKDLLHILPADLTVERADDVALMGYLLEYRLAPTTAAELFGLRDECEKELAARDMTKLYRDIELPLLYVLFDMEKTGVAVDRQKLDEIDAHFTALEAENAKRIRELCGKDFNLNSPKQLATVLFEEMGIPYPGKPPYSTKAEILQQLAGEYEVIDEILKYRFNSKIKSTFIDGVRKAMRGDCTVHTSFNQMSTATGRLSSTDPNLQNIPTRADEGRILRSMFVARSGNVLVDADYSQIELKLLAHYSGDPKMIAAFNNGSDIHRSTAAEVFGVDPNDVTPAMRRDAKAVNFGIIYGISNFGLGRNIHISARKADAYIKKYFERFPAVKAYLDGLVEAAKKNGYAVTEFKRRRTIPELNSAKYTMRKFGERVAMNTPLQGTAADIIKIAMINVHKKLAGMKSRLILQVHDELVIDAAADELDRVKEILKTEMENAVKLSVPLNVDISAGGNWMECK